MCFAIPKECEEKKALGSSTWTTMFQELAELHEIPELQAKGLVVVPALDVALVADTTKKEEGTVFSTSMTTDLLLSGVDKDETMMALTGKETASNTWTGMLPRFPRVDKDDDMTTQKGKATE
mmetsp:Transcript_24946/g.38127  ORF Transcript_24946/g.38127 Transcript_24946/m.38127 type:complete len:122 (+) Transcript_24946:542-907(+)